MSDTTATPEELVGLLPRPPQGVGTVQASDRQALMMDNATGREFTVVTEPYGPAPGYKFIALESSAEDGMSRSAGPWPTQVIAMEEGKHYVNHYIEQTAPATSMPNVRPTESEQYRQEQSFYQKHDARIAERKASEGRVSGLTNADRDAARTTHDAPRLTTEHLRQSHLSLETSSKGREV